MSVTPRRFPSTAAILVLLVTLSLCHTPPSHAGTGWSTESGTGSVSLLVKTRVDITPSVLSSISGHAVRVSSVWPEIRALAVVANTNKIVDIEANPFVAFVERDVEAGVTINSEPESAAEIPAVVVPLSTATTPIQTWNQDMADTPGSGKTGAGVTVAMIDAGLPQNWQEFLPEDCVDLEHAAGFGAEGWGDFHAQINAIRGAGGHIGLFPHGLACSSVIVGFPSDAGFIGGAAPGAKILPIRVLNQFNTGWFSWFAAAFVYVGNLKASGAIPGPMVVNFSIQAGSNSQILKDAIDYAISQGVLVVTIAGNFNPFLPVSFPGRLPEVITAGASGWRSEGGAPGAWFFGDVPEGDASQIYVASFSGREPPSVPAASQIDVLAPGSFVFGEWLYGPGFSEGRAMGFNAIDNFIFGTSFAGPHVVGIVAQMLEKNHTLTQADAEAILRATALPVPASPAYFFTPIGNFVPAWDDHAVGAGHVQGTAAVAATPPGPAVAARFGRGMGARTGPEEPTAPRLSVRISSPVGSVPVEFGMKNAAGSGYRATVFDLSGRLVRRWEGEIRMGGRGTWDGRRRDGSEARSGVYFLRVESGDQAATAKVVLSR